MKDNFTEGFKSFDGDESFSFLKSKFDQLRDSLNKTGTSFQKINEVIEKLNKNAAAHIQTGEKFNKEFFEKTRKMVEETSDLHLKEKKILMKKLLDIEIEYLKKFKDQLGKDPNDLNRSNYNETDDLEKRENAKKLLGKFSDSFSLNQLMERYYAAFSSGSPEAYFKALAKNLSDAISVLGSAIKKFGEFIEQLGTVGFYLGKFIGFLGSAINALAQFGGALVQFGISTIMALARYQNEISEMAMNLSKLVDPTKFGSGESYRDSVSRVLSRGYAAVAPGAGLGITLNPRDLSTISMNYLAAGFSKSEVEKMGYALGIFEVTKRAYGQFINDFEGLMRKLTNFTSKTADQVSKDTMRMLQMVSSMVPEGLSKKYMQEAWGAAAHEAFQYGIDSISVSVLQTNIMGLNNALKTAGVDLNKSMKNILMDILGIFQKWGDGLKAYMAHTIFGAKTGNVFSSMLQYEYGPNAQIVMMPDGTRKLINAATGKNIYAEDNAGLLEMRLKGIQSLLDKVVSPIQDESTRWFVGIKFLTEELKLSRETAKAVYLGGGKLTNLSDFAKNELKFSGDDIKTINIRLFTEAERNNIISLKMLQIQAASFELIVNILTMILMGLDKILSYLGIGFLDFTNEQKKVFSELNKALLKSNAETIYNITRDLYRISGMESAAKSMNSLSLVGDLFSGSKNLSPGKAQFFQDFGQLLGKKEELKELKERPLLSSWDNINMMLSYYPDINLVRERERERDAQIKELTKAISDLTNKINMNSQYKDLPIKIILKDNKDNVRDQIDAKINSSK